MQEASDRFATISDDCTVRVWDASDYSVITRVAVKDAGVPLSLVYTLDLLISGWQDGQVGGGVRRQSGMHDTRRSPLPSGPRLMLGRPLGAA